MRLLLPLLLHLFQASTAVNLMAWEAGRTKEVIVCNDSSNMECGRGRGSEGVFLLVDRCAGFFSCISLVFK